MQQDTTLVTDSVRINKEILDKVRVISKIKGQTISGYINTIMDKQVSKDWLKFNVNNEKKNSI